MTRKPVFRPQADQEVQSAGQWYEDQRPGLGMQFANAIDEVLKRISSNPLAFPEVHGETRRAVVRRSRTASKLFRLKLSLAPIDEPRFQHRAGP